MHLTRIFLQAKNVVKAGPHHDQRNDEEAAVTEEARLPQTMHPVPHPSTSHRINDDNHEQNNHNLHQSDNAIISGNDEEVPKVTNDITMSDMQQLFKEIQVMKATNESEKKKLLLIEERVLLALGEHRDETPAPPSFSNGYEKSAVSRFQYFSLLFRMLAYLFIIQMGFATLLRDAAGSKFVGVVGALLFLFSVIISVCQICLNIEIMDKTSVIIGLVGHLINFVGGIIFIIAVHDYVFENLPDQLNPNLLVAFAFLAAGHAVKLLNVFIKMLRLRKKVVPILLAIFSLILPVIAFALPIAAYDILLNAPLRTICIACVLLMISLLAEFRRLFQRAVEATSDEDQDINDSQSQSGVEPEPDPEPEPEPLPDEMLDTFSLMMISDNLKAWDLTSFFFFFLQASLSTMILYEQVYLSNEILPATPPLLVLFAQFFALSLAILWQTDIFTSIRMLRMLRYHENDNWPYDEIGAKDGSRMTWLDKVMLPNVLRLMGGVFVLATSFVVIIKSESVIDLFKDFAALIVISEIHTIIFRLANQGFFGKKLKEETEKLKEIRLVDADSNTKILRMPVRIFSLLVVSVIMFGVWLYFINGQIIRTFFLMQHPKCYVDYPLYIKDGHCHGGDYNTEECGYDGGDCSQFNEIYPNCTVGDLFNIGNGDCNGEDYNTTECGYDGGDCLVV